MNIKKSQRSKEYEKNAKAKLSVFRFGPEARKTVSERIKSQAEEKSVKEFKWEDPKKASNKKDKVTDLEDKNENIHICHGQKLPAVVSTVCHSLLLPWHAATVLTVLTS